MNSTSDVHSILVEPFSERGEGFFVPPILKLRKIELTSFISVNINDFVMMQRKWIVII